MEKKTSRLSPTINEKDRNSSTAFPSALFLIPSCVPNFPPQRRNGWLQPVPNSTPLLLPHAFPSSTRGRSSGCRGISALVPGAAPPPPLLLQRPCCSHCSFSHFASSSPAWEVFLPLMCLFQVKS